MTDITDRPMDIELAIAAFVSARNTLPVEAMAWALANWKEAGPP